MNPLSIARWQFAITTVYHFIFVPITIGSGFLVSGLQTAWFRTHKEKYLRATKFFAFNLCAMALRSRNSMASPNQVIH